MKKPPYFKNPCASTKDPCIYLASCKSWRGRKADFYACPVGFSTVTDSRRVHISAVQWVKEHRELDCPSEWISGHQYMPPPGKRSKLFPAYIAALLKGLIK